MLEHYVSLPEHYYNKDHYYDFAGFFAPIPKNARILNAGCGRGTSLREYPKGVGIDFNQRLCKLWAAQSLGDRCLLANIAEGLGYETWDFDWTISSDFLEHLQPQDVTPAVRELVRIAPAGRHVIDLLQESGYRGPNNENLHPSANNEAFWRAEFRRANVLNLRAFTKRRHLFVIYGEEIHEPL